ncbi:hypothetical protein sS8_4340 [Methylocaldum marinum]|uniref:Uncharacterized protein n=1 Tax=Methylocaldum marinum TaxID=1432792 RepID=A0A250KX89_9GAMM|nr:hypothetical protein sS8_4340 [Methylocaldum marinum]
MPGTAISRVSLGPKHEEGLLRLMFVTDTEACHEIIDHTSHTRIIGSVPGGSRTAASAGNLQSGYGD